MVRLLMLLFPGMLIAQTDSFLANQLSYPRVARATAAIDTTVQRKLKQCRAAVPLEIFIRAFKQEKLLQIFVREMNSEFVRYDNFKICAASGKLGPKSKQGDMQVPEGFYEISVFNPESKYHLSLGINYPNAADSMRSRVENKGGEIYIHGECSSVGCLAMGEKIEEIYVLAVMARSQGQQVIPVHIFPFKMSEKNYVQYVNPKSKWNKFWRNLQAGFLYFENKKELPLVGVDSNGEYTISDRE